MFSKVSTSTTSFIKKNLNGNVLRQRLKSAHKSPSNMLSEK